MTAKTKRMSEERRAEIWRLKCAYSNNVLAELLEALESAYRELDALIESAREIIQRAEPFAELAQSQWADDNDLSQETHWLNVAKQELAALI